MAPGAPGMDQPAGMKCRLAAGDPLDSRNAPPPVLSQDDHADRVQRMGYAGQNCPTQCWNE